MSESESSTTRPNAESFNSFETAEIDKREIIKRQLETNFPMKTTVLFGSELVLIGIVGIFLQIGLIANKALNYEIGNGIWGGFFAILNGLVRLNMGIIRDHLSYDNSILFHLFADLFFKLENEPIYRMLFTGISELF